jgi:hypothetical protein
MIIAVVSQEPPLIPPNAPAGLPDRETYVAELMAACAPASVSESAALSWEGEGYIRDVITTLSELDDAPTLGASLPALLCCELECLA